MDCVSMLYCFIVDFGVYYSGDWPKPFK